MLGDCNSFCKGYLICASEAQTCGNLEVPPNVKVFLSNFAAKTLN